MKTHAVLAGLGLAMALSACETSNTTFIDNARVTTISQTTLVSVIGGNNLSVGVTPVNSYTDASGRPCQIHTFQDASGQGIGTVCFDGQRWLLVDRSYDTQPVGTPPPAAEDPANPAGDWNAVTN